MTATARAVARVRSSSWLSALVWISTSILTVTAVLYWRRPDAFYNPQLWAEDGGRFFTSAFSWGIRSLTFPFAGYFHTLARIAAWLASWLPPAYAPHGYAFASWALLISIIGYLFSPRLPFADWQKWCMSLALVATTADNEVFFNLANWATITTFFWLLLLISREPESKGQMGFDWVILLLAGLSTPFAICLWPLFLLRWGFRRSRHSLILLMLSLIVAVIQLWNMPYRLAGGEAPQFSALVVDGLIVRFGFMFLGERAYQVPLTGLTRVGGVLIVFGAYGLLTWQACKSQNWPQLTILAGGVAAAVLSLFVMRNVAAEVALHSGRHFFLPAVTFAWVLLLSPQPYKWLPLGMMLAAFLFWTPGSKAQTLPNLDWAGHIAACGDTPRCRIPTNPVTNPPNWFATINGREFTPPPLQTHFVSRFGDQVILLGYDARQDGATLQLNLVWRSLAWIDRDLGFFVDLFDLNHPNAILRRVAGAAARRDYPTSRWATGEIVVDLIEVALDELPPGRYAIAIRWYDAHDAGWPALKAYDAENQALPHDRAILPLNVVVE